MKKNEQPRAPAQMANRQDIINGEMAVVVEALTHMAQNARELAALADSMRKDLKAKA